MQKKYLIQYENNPSNINEYKKAKNLFKEIGYNDGNINKKTIDILKKVPNDIIIPKNRINIMPFLIYKNNPTIFQQLDHELQYSEEYQLAQLLDGIKKHAIGLITREYENEEKDYTWYEFKIYPCYGNELITISQDTFDEIIKTTIISQNNNNLYNINIFHEAMLKAEQNISNKIDIISIQNMVNNKTTYTNFTIKPIIPEDPWEDEI